MDAGARVLVTADGVYRGTKLIKLLEIAYSAMDKAKEGGCEVGSCFLPGFVNPVDLFFLSICAAGGAPYLRVTPGPPLEPRGPQQAQGGHQCALDHSQVKQIF